MDWTGEGRPESPLAVAGLVLLRKFQTDWFTTPGLGEAAPAIRMDRKEFGLGGLLKVAPWGLCWRRTWLWSRRPGAPSPSGHRESLGRGCWARAI